MFRTRLISGIVLVALAILLVTKGGVLLYCVTAAISLIGMFELYRVMGIEKKAPGIAGYLACLGYYGLVWFEGQHYVTLLAIAALMVLMSIYVFTFPKYGTEQITVAFFGIFYLGIMLSYLYQVRAMADGKYLVWLILLSSWGCDTFAYCVGKLFGKHKMTPKLSPKKTVEGAIFGVVGGTIGGLICRAVFVYAFHMPMPGIPAAIALGLIGSVAGEIGDLSASLLKRHSGIKDYGKIFPGHGGVMDRFDSVIFTLIVMYCYTLVL